MKSLLWFLTLSILATGIALSVGLNTGYVLIVVSPWRIEISLAVFVIGLALIMLALYGFSRLIYTTVNLPGRIQAYRLRRSRNRARSALYQGLSAYFEGNFRRAEHQVEIALEANESPALCAVVAARSAHEQRQFDVRDRYLDRLNNAGPEARLMHLNTRAELLLDEKRNAEALDLLREAHRLAPKQIRAHQLLLRAQLALSAWKPALETVDLLEHLNGIDSAQALRFRRNAWQQLLRLNTNQGEELMALWRTIPSSIRLDNALAHSAVSYMIDLGLHKEAQAVLERNLEKKWDSTLVALYGECEGEPPLSQIEKAERWLRDYPDNAVLLLTLAKLCARQSLWGKAQSYLDASLFIEPSREGQQLKLTLAEKMGPLRNAPSRPMPDPDPEYGAA